MTEKHALDDHFLLERIRQIVDERGLTTVVETGIAHGDSALKFCRSFTHYIGIDLNPSCIERTRQTLDHGGANNATLYLGNSPDVLSSIMHALDFSHTMFFLDAHNFPYYGAKWPFPDELKALPRGQGVLALHDFRVPGKDFGVDQYSVDGVMRDFDYDLIKDMLMEWSPDHRVEYMQEADPTSSYRGAAFVYPS